MNPQWTYIIPLALGAGTVYAWAVRRINDHPRYGPFFSRLAWLEVVAGNLLVGAFLLWLSLDAMTLMMYLTVNAVLGAPQVLGSLLSHARDEARERDAQIVQG
jgi:hypothetical protein